MTKRLLCITRKVRTDFGNYFIQIDLAPDGRPAGGRIASPGKEPGGQIHRLVETLSEALGEALADAGGELPE